MLYSAFVKDKETGEKRFIESDYPTRSNFLNDLKANGYTVYRAEPKEVYDYILRNTNGSKTDWEIAKKLYKENKPLTKEEFEKMKDVEEKLDYEVVNDKSIDAIKDNFTPPGAKSQKEDVKEEIDTNNNGKIEVDEMADFQKSLDDYAAKNKKGREDIPATYKR